MTEILALARKCGARVLTLTEGVLFENHDQLRAFAEAVRMEERERAATLISSGKYCRYVEHVQGFCDCAEMAAAIRSTTEGTQT